MTAAAYLPHTTTAGERWDLLAHRYYGDISRQAMLIAINRDLFAADMQVPALLPAGLVLRIPIIEQSTLAPNTLLPPWKQS